MMKAVLLLSGGLDSTLVGEMMVKEGIELLAVNYKTPFCQCDKKGVHGCAHTALTVASRLGIKCRVINAGEDFLKILQHPKHGYGANMNPCQDCRILFFRKAKEIMEEIGASFIITGEVVGQRPMSQLKRQLTLIEKESGLEGMVVRPLSAKLLPPSIPEEKGWINRDHLLSMSGRSRKPQVMLAKELGLNDYPCAAGGCLLTDPGFAKRVKDLKVYGPFDMPNIEILKVGRHFRLSRQAKLVVGRNEQENNYLLRVAKPGEHIFKTIDIPGPVALGRGVLSLEHIEFAARTVCWYSDLNARLSADISHAVVGEANVEVIPSFPLSENDLNLLRI
ncbi:MAG: hypothetical protein HQL22_03985 [Candidatus Omnitrophica bacterium]|nr:hypothetical protein [Candidatus Omnitrophota bacterium]